jgi:uncharacterized protein (UPF0262 family)
LLTERERKQQSLPTDDAVSRTLRQIAFELDVGQYDFLAVWTAPPADAGSSPYRAHLIVAADDKVAGDMLDYELGLQRCVGAFCAVPDSN